MSEKKEENNITKFSWVKDDKTRRYLQAIYRVQHFYSTITDLDQLLVLITEECKDVCNAESASLLLYDEKRKCLNFQVTLGPVGSEIIKKEIKISEGTGIAGEVAQTRKPRIVNDVSKESKFYPKVDEITQYKTKNILAVPMIHNKKLIGVIEIINKKNNEQFTHEDLRFLEIFASWAGSAVVTSRLIQEKIQAERLATIGYTLTALAHQLKNILTAMITSVGLIEISFEKNQYETIKKALPILKRTSLYILEFVQDLLLYSKPRIPQKTYCSLDELAKKLKEIFDNLFATREVNFIIDFTKVNRPVLLDPNGIFHCLTNLLINASESVSPKVGEVKITGELKNDNLLSIAVSDNGKGIPEEELPFIFDPFHSSKGYKGTGLGLAVTKKIVEEHKGTIEVKNNPGGGVQFIIYIPQPDANKKGSK